MTNVLSEQEIFNQVADHLLTQKKKSYDKKAGACAYRGPNGLKCAVGGILADDEIVPLKYGNANTFTVYELKLPERLLGHQDFLRRLQIIHDTKKPSRWIEKLSAFAKLNKLDSSVLNKYRKKKVEKVLTDQEVFDQAVTHLLTQNKRSIQITNRLEKVCLYRGPNGLKCAVGGLLNDNEIIRDEAYPYVNSDINSAPLRQLLLPPRLSGKANLLEQLQWIHDNNKPSRWYGKLSAMAKLYNFDRTVLNSFKKKNAVAVSA